MKYLILLLFLTGCSSMQHCKDTCLKLAKENPSIKFKCETNDDSCNCDVTRGES